jgi:ribosomal protein S18 acetylase RimI-like enzyme
LCCGQAKAKSFAASKKTNKGCIMGHLTATNWFVLHRYLSENGSARLRKFATLHDYQGKGIGSQVLQRIISDLQAKQVRQLWCDARETAVGLYQRFAMNKCGERFYKGDVPYFRMSVEWHD